MPLRQRVAWRCRYAEQYANDIADLLAPQSGAYYDVWLDGEKFFSHTMEVSGRQLSRRQLATRPLSTAGGVAPGRLQAGRGACATCRPRRSECGPPTAQLLGLLLGASC